MPSALELMGAWVKALFGLMVAGLVGFFFESALLFWVTAIFLVIIPHPDRNSERKINALVFGIGMVAILFAAFDAQPFTLILGVLAYVAYVPVMALTGFFIHPRGFDLATGFGLDLGVTGVSLAAASVILGLIALAAMARLMVGIAPAAPAWTRFGIRPTAKGKGWLTAGIVILFIIFLLIAQPWSWGTLAFIFTAIWLVAFFVGLGSDPKSRPGLGIVFILASAAIFTASVGFQVVGANALGQWFPTIYQTGWSALGPLGDAFDGISQVLRDALRLITDPTGYAQSILNGTYVKDPDTGLAGAFGVELTDLRLTPVYAEQPYSSLIKIQNNGAFEATSVLVRLKLGANPPKDATLQTLGFDSISPPHSSATIRCTPTECSQWVDGNPANRIAKVDLRQVAFDGSGITCASAVDLGLHKQFLPLKGTVEYDYGTDSTLSLEFISTAEWDRLVLANRIVTQAKQPAQLKNSPVRLNIDTLEQPIREGTRHHIAVNLVSAKANGKVTNPAITLEIPKTMGPASEAEFDTLCRPVPTTKSLVTAAAPPAAAPAAGSVYRLTWNNALFIRCNLPAFAFDASGAPSTLPPGPTATYVIRAHATYRFEETKDFTPGKVEFGGTPCCETDSDCSAGQACQANKTCGSPPTSTAGLLQRINQQLDNLTRQIREMNALAEEELRAREGHVKAVITAGLNLLVLVRDEQSKADAADRILFDPLITQIQDAIKNQRNLCNLYFKSCP